MTSKFSKHNITEQYVMLDFVNYDINSDESNNSNFDINANKNKFAIINGTINEKYKSTNCINLDPSELNEYSYIIDYKKFTNHLIKNPNININEINNDNPVIKQLKLDIPRSKIYVNGRLVNRSENFIDYLLCKYNKEPYKFVLIGSLCTQAIFSLPITLIQQNIKSNYLIAELAYQEYTEKKLEKNHVIKLELSENKCKCSAYKWLRIVDLDDNNNPRTKFIFCLIIKFNNKDDYVVIDIALLQ